jgi:hypothetical protein
MFFNFCKLDFRTNETSVVSETSTSVLRSGRFAADSGWCACRSVPLSQGLIYTRSCICRMKLQSERVAGLLAVCMRLLWEWNSVLLDGEFTQLRDLTREKLEWEALIYTLIILINHSGLSHTIEQVTTRHQQHTKS